MSSDVQSFAEQGLLPIKDLLTDEKVNEVVINPDGRIFVEYNDAAYMRLVDDVELSETDIRSLGSNLAGETGNALGEDQPIVSDRVYVFGSDVRVQVVVPPPVSSTLAVLITAPIPVVTPQPM